MTGTPVGQTKDAGFQIGVSRTLPVPAATAWAYLTGPGLARWLGPGADLEPRRGAAYATDDGATGEVRGYRAGAKIRLTYRAGDGPESTVQVTVTPRPGGATVRFHQERLRDADERARRRDHWSAVMDAIEAELAPAR